MTLSKTAQFDLIGAADPPMKTRTPPKNPVSTFIANAQANWKRIEAALRAHNVPVIQAYEAAMAQHKSQHFNEDLAEKFMSAYSQIMAEITHEKSAGRKRA